MKKVKIIILSFILFISPLTSFASDSAVITQVPSVPIAVAQIKQAKALLEEVKLNYALTPHYKTIKQPRKKPTTKQVLSNYTLDTKDIALAILDPASGDIKITSGTQRDTNFNFSDKNFDIQKIRFNGVNTRFTVNKPSGGKVLAIKYLITPTESGSKSTIENSLYSGIYVPYSPELVTPEVSQYGANYLDGVINGAVADLQNTQSVSVPGQTIPNAIRPELVRALLYAEHMDTSEFLSNPNTQNLIDKINILLAGNEGDTWKYSVSSAGAAGISQFIPSTYASLVKRHAQSGLIPDFVQGMRNHINAVKATYLLLDDYIAAVHTQAGDAFLTAHAFDYGVAAYNGGTVRVAKAAIAFGPVWSQDHSNEISPLQDRVARQNAVVNALKNQIKKTKKTADKAKLKLVLAKEQGALNDAQSQLATTQASVLRGETVNYVFKIDKLIQIFNDYKPQQVLASR